MSVITGINLVVAILSVVGFGIGVVDLISEESAVVCLIFILLTISLVLVLSNPRNPDRARGPEPKKYTIVVNEEFRDRLKEMGIQQVFGWGGQLNRASRSGRPLAGRIVPILSNRFKRTKAAIITWHHITTKHMN